MVGSNVSRKRPHGKDMPHDLEGYNWDQHPVPAQDIPEREAPPRVFALPFLSLRRHPMAGIRGLIHVHSNGLRTRMPHCPLNATCLGIDDISEFMYNQAQRSRRLKEEMSKISERYAPRSSYEPAAKKRLSANEKQAQLSDEQAKPVKVDPPESGKEPEKKCDSPKSSSEQP